MGDLKRTGTFLGVMLLIVMAVMFTLPSCGDTAKAANVEHALVEYGGAIYACDNVEVKGNVLSATTSSGYHMIISGSFRVVELKGGAKEAIPAIQKLQLRGTILK